jgi:hypothetical protein
MVSVKTLDDRVSGGGGGRFTCGDQAQRRQYLGEDPQLPIRFDDCAAKIKL